MLRSLFKSKESKSAIIYTIANFLTKALGVITLPFYTKYLSESEIGLTSLFSTWYSILLTIFTMGTTTAAFISAFSNYKDDKYAFIFSINILSVISVAVLSGIYFFIAFLIGNPIAIDLNLVGLMFICFLVTPSFEFFMLAERYEYKYKMTAILSVAQSIVSVLAGILAVIIFKNKNYDISLGSVKLYSTNIVMIIFGLCFFIFFAVKSKCKVKPSYWKYIIPIAIPLIVHSLSKTVLDSSDKIMIEQFVGLDAVGVYGTVYNIGTLILVFWNAINTSFIPYMFETLKCENFKQKLNKVIIIILVGFSVLSLITCMFAPEILKLLTTKTYVEAVYLIPPIIAGVYLTAVYNIYANVLIYKRRTYLIMIGTIISAAINIGLNYLLIPKYGMIAASYTTLLGFVVLAIIEYVFMRSVLKGDVANSWIVLIITLLTVGSCLLVNLLYEHNIARYIIIVSIFFLCIIFYKQIFKLVKSLLVLKGDRSADLSTQSIDDKELQNENIEEDM